MEQAVTFTSDGLKLAGIVHRPQGISANVTEKRAAMLVLHGFGSNKSGGVS